MRCFVISGSAHDPNGRQCRNTHVEGPQVTPRQIRLSRGAGSTRVLFLLQAVPQPIAELHLMRQPARQARIDGDALAAKHIGQADQCSRSMSAGARVPDGSSGPPRSWADPPTAPGEGRRTFILRFCGTGRHAYTPIAVGMRPGPVIINKSYVQARDDHHSGPLTGLHRRVNS